MNEIRKNEEKEIVLAEAKCKMPKIIIVLCMVGLIAFFIFLVVMLNLIFSNYAYDRLIIFVPFIIAFIGLLSYFIFCITAISKTGVYLTNKRIYGTAFYKLTKKNYSYRLDTINSVELGQSFGNNTIIIDFLHGNDHSSGNDCTFVIKYLSNFETFYEKLNEMILSIKNDKDLQTDLQVNKIDVENKKAIAMEKIAEKYNSDVTKKSSSEDYITQLRRLKELLDCGIISQEEFDEKKKKLLGLF